MARDRLVAAARRHAIKPVAGEEYYGGGPEAPAEEEPVPIQEQIDGVITRNHYGCIVLNAAHALFIDVDVLGKAEPCRPVEPWQRVLTDLRTVLSNERDEGFRIYRTAAGFRIIALGREYEPTSPQSAGLMDCVGADADFVSLCRIQNSFRARLTPKPWRCGVRRPPNFFPRETVQESFRFTQWLDGYERACRGYATCQYLGHVGPQHIDKRIAPIVTLHDRETKAHAALPLA
ncbi:MAG TPA: hypothetical protein VGK58_04670 [Lacipirellulaceae bacterium]